MSDIPEVPVDPLRDFIELLLSRDFFRYDDTDYDGLCLLSHDGPDILETDGSKPGSPTDDRISL